MVSPDRSHIDTTDLARLRIRRDEPPSAAPTRRRHWWLAGGGLALLAVLAGGGALLRSRAPEVHVFRLEAGPARGAGAAAGLTANGYVVPRTQASVSSKVPGRLAFLGVEEGDVVRAGQVLARLEAAEIEAAIHEAEAGVLSAQATRLEAEARLAQARRELQRSRSLAERELAAQQTVQDAETAEAAAAAQLGAAAARVAAARAGLAAAHAQLENTRVRAPFDGTVLRKDAELGEVVAPSIAGGGLTRGAVVTMADLSALDVEADVNEAYIAQIRRGQPAEIVLDAYPGERFPGHVRQVVPTADRQRATVLVRVAVDTADPRILSEMAARVVFLERAAEPAAVAPARLFVPDSLVHNLGGRDVVWVVAEGRARQRAVEAGPVTAGQRELRRGLLGGELLIVDLPAGLRDGAAVRVRAGGNNR